MKDVKDVTCMVVDCGLFVEIARRLGRTYKKVYYCNPSWVTPFPVMNSAWIGKGFPEIEVVMSPYEHYDEIDLYVFPDVGFGQMQVHLESLGKAVWGSRNAEELEFYREDNKKLMKEYGLPVGKYEIVKGIPNLRKHLQKHENQWVKIDIWRGMFETFDAPNYKLVEPRIDELEVLMGAFKTEAEFIVEDALDDCEESGVDGFMIDGEMPESLLCGIEVKDLGYVAKYVNYKDIPDPITLYERTLKKVFAEYGYRGFFSTEVRISKDKTPYMNDLCARGGSPPNELYQEMFVNLPEIVWYGANGEIVEPEPIAQWGAEILIHSSWAIDNWQPIDFPEEFAKRVKLRNAVKISDRLYVMPQVGKLPEIGAVIGWGKTMDSAIKNAKEVADSIQGYFIDMPVECTDKATQAIENVRKLFPEYLK
jgi:hypothetical protein